MSVELGRTTSAAARRPPRAGLPELRVARLRGLSFRADALHEKLATLETEVERRLVGDIVTPPTAQIDEPRPGSPTEAFDAEVGF